jgi:hypothetical protein
MQKENVQQIIMEYARENFNAYPESYPIEEGLSTSEAMENAQDLGKNYFEHRNEIEVERDDALDITEIDYVEFVKAAFEDWVQNQI